MPVERISVTTGALPGLVAAYKKVVSTLSVQTCRRFARKARDFIHAYIDGRIVRVGAERFEAPEALFEPNRIDVDSPGMAEQLFQSIQGADMDIRSDLYNHIVLSGGSSMYPGLPSRLEKEIRSLYLDRVLKGNDATLHVSRFRV